MVKWCVAIICVILWQIRGGPDKVWFGGIGIVKIGANRKQYILYLKFVVEKGT